MLLLLLEVSYDDEKSKADKQAAKRAEILAIEAYKKTHAQKLVQASQLSVNRTSDNCSRSNSSIYGMDVSP